MSARAGMTTAALRVSRATARSGSDSASRGVFRAAVMALLALLCGLQLLALVRAPAAWMPGQITLRLARGGAVALDGAALALPQGGAAALRLRRDANGRWWAGSGDAGTTLALLAGGHPGKNGDHGGRARRSASVLLARGQAFQLGAARFTVDDVAGADGAALAFSSAGVQWRYDGATLRRGARAQPPCPDSRPAARLVRAWNAIAPAALTLARPVVFGGNLDCGNRIAVAGLPDPSLPGATIARTADGLLLSGGAAPLLLREADGQHAGLLAQREAPLDEVAALILDRTRYAIQTKGELLLLRPMSHVALLAEAQQALPSGVTWTWTRRDAWALPAAPAPDGAPSLAPSIALWLTLAATLAAALAPVVLAVVRGGAGVGAAWRGAGAALLFGAGLALLAQRGAAPPGVGVSMLVAWAALWFPLVFDRRFGLAGGAGALLLAVGLLAQLDLGLGAPASSWLRHFHKSAAVLALGTGAVHLLRLWAPAVRWSQARVEMVLLALTGLALLALLLQVAFGDETGVFELQPVEFAKLALAALSAHCLALAGAAAAGHATNAPWRRWLRLLAPTLLFVVLLGVALVQVDDYSPLVLLLVWGGAVALAAALGARRRAVVLLLAGAGCALVLSVAGLRGAGAERIGDVSGRWNFYPDRFMVWLAPNAHPHTGQQLLLGARAVADGGWWGADDALGLRALGRDPGAALRIPAVQDDFAPAFFLQRHGLAAGIGLWLLQALFLAGLLRCALRCWQDGAQAGDYRAAWLARLRCYALVGGAAFAFGHFLLSWGTNLAILPVMGQPMSFLSAGGSHLLFFICPLLGMAAASTHARSQSRSHPH